MRERDSVGAYIGRCGECGGMTAVIVDECINPDHVAIHRKEVAAFCSDIVKRGDRLERTTIGEVHRTRLRHEPICSEAEP